MSDTLTTDGVAIAQERRAAEAIERGEAMPEPERLGVRDGVQVPAYADLRPLGGAVVDAAIDRLTLELRGRRLTPDQRDRLVALVDGATR
jgi:hypothetical protein